VSGSADDPAVLQQNSRASELRFCCKCGHAAILPSHQFLRARSPPGANDASDLLRQISPAVHGEPEARVADFDGLVTAVDLAMTATIAAGAMKGQQLTRTLARSPVRRRRQIVF
jgi:hypothetical protein